MSMVSERCHALLCRQTLLASPLGLWNHLDIDFAAEIEEIVPGSYTKNAKKVCLQPSARGFSPLAVAEVHFLGVQVCLVVVFEVLSEPGLGTVRTLFLDTHLTNSVGKEFACIEAFYEWQEIRESRVLQWVRPRAAAVKSLRLRGGEDGRGRKEKYSHRGPITSAHDFTG